MAKTQYLLICVFFTTLVVKSLQEDPKHRNSNLLPTKTCGIVQASDRVIRGSISELFEFPWMALLRYSSGKKDSGFKCSGTLINEKYILTAAHCVITPGKLSLSSVRLGEYDLSTDIDCEEPFNDEKICASSVQDFDVEEIIPHPAYDAKLHQNDIALVRINGTPTFSESIRPICLPVSSNLRNQKFVRPIVTSWGRTKTGAEINVLMRERLPIVETEQCQELYKSFGSVTITNKQICAGGNERSGPCVGDGGSPLVVVTNEPRYVQHGIVSFGPSRCSAKGIPDVFTRVSEYMDWILDQLKP